MADYVILISIFIFGCIFGAFLVNEYYRVRLRILERKCENAIWIAWQDATYMAIRSLNGGEENKYEKVYAERLAQKTFLERIDQ